MLTNVKLHEIYKLTLKSLIEKAFSTIQLSENREAEDAIMEDFPMLKGIPVGSVEFNIVVNKFLQMVTDALAIEEEEEFPDDFVEQYGFNISTLQFALTVGAVFETQNNKSVFTCDEMNGSFELEDNEKPTLRVINGGKE